MYLSTTLSASEVASIYLSARPGLGIELDKNYMRGHVIEGCGKVLPVVRPYN